MRACSWRSSSASSSSREPRRPAGGSCLAQRFALLGDSIRLRLLLCIKAAGLISVCDLAVATDLNDVTVSQTLRFLRASHTVITERDGRIIDSKTPSSTSFSQPGHLARVDGIEVLGAGRCRAACSAARSAIGVDGGAGAVWQECVDGAGPGVDCDCVCPVPGRDGFQQFEALAVYDAQDAGLADRDVQVRQRGVVDHDIGSAGQGNGGQEGSGVTVDDWQPPRCRQRRKGARRRSAVRAAPRLGR